jgi:predicted molibdopterin-dependent oxidoreductase YjgC
MRAEDIMKECGYIIDELVDENPPSPKMKKALHESMPTFSFYDEEAAMSSDRANVRRIVQVPHFCGFPCDLIIITSDKVFSVPACAGLSDAPLTLDGCQSDRVTPIR